MVVLFQQTLADVRQDFEGGQAVAKAVFQRIEPVDGFAGVAYAHQRSGVGGGPRKQLERGGGDQPQLAFGADEQLFDVQPTGVFAQPA
ncbi:hypothetical protein [Paludibacterium denitrificans]|uniref:hypothetical protein n=1 Tax=Paludibacterium denitrificans TaxID=2675226 RepID=UPI001E5F30E8|nr:hypothetical protein [Paludibacterium denitrificans]